MESPTVEWLMEQVIGWEEQLRDWYEAMSERFSNHEEAAALFHQLAIDESSHAALVRRAREDMTADRLSQSLSRADLEAAEGARAAMTDLLRTPIDTLDAAYEAAHSAESSEINVVFHIVAIDTAQESSLRELLALQLEHHVERLTRFGADHPRDHRRHVYPSR